MLKHYFKYDKSADAAYLFFTPQSRGTIARTSECEEENINFDFNSDDRLVGIEILDASKRFPEKVIESGKLDDLSLAYIRVADIACITFFPEILETTRVAATSDLSIIFDDRGVLIGIEIKNASRLLFQGALE